MSNMINWFEIPASDIKRAKNFYQTMLNVEMTESEIMGTQMAFLPSDGSAVSGAVVAGEDYTPSTDGALLYINGGDDLQVPLSRVEGAGGKVVLPKTHISDEIGYFAILIDTEGNRIALHSMS